MKNFLTNRVFFLLLAGLSWLFLAASPPLFAQEPGASHLWEKAAFGGIPGVTHVKLEGWNPAITTTFEVVWEESAAYTPLVAAMSTPYCASSSTDDDGSPAGTGANTIRISGINTSGVAFTEDLTLNGTTSVNLTTTNVQMIHKIEVLTVGSGKVNAGIIQCGTGTNTSGDPAVPHAYLGVSSPTAIPAAGVGGGGVSKAFMYAVPDNYTLLCRNVQVGSVFATAASGMMATIDGYELTTQLFKRYYAQMIHNTGANPSNDGGLIKIPENTLVVGRMAGATGSNTGPASMSAECLLISNTWEATSQALF